MNTSRFNPILAHLIVALSLSATASTFAATGTWSATTGGNWENANTAPWVDGIVADGATFTANITSDILADTTVTLTENRTIGNITFNDTGAAADSRWILAASGGSVLTLDNGGSDAVITKTSVCTISAPLASSGNVSITGGGNLTISGNNTGLVGSVKVGGVNQIFIDNNNALGSAGLSINGQPALSAVTNDVTLTNAVTFMPTGDNLLWTGNGGKALNLNGVLTLNATNTASQGFRMWLSDITQSGNVVLGDKNLSVLADNRQLTISGNISGTGGIIKSHSGVLLLSGSNSYSGTTSVTGGTLTLDYTNNNTNKLGTSTVALGAGVAFRFIGNASASTSQTLPLSNAIDGGSILLDTAAGQSLTAIFTGGSLTNRGLYVATTGTGTAQLILPGTVASTALLPNVVINNTFAGTDANNYVIAASGAVDASTSDLSLWSTGSTQYVSNVTDFTNTVGSGVTVDGITFDFPAARTVTIGTGNTLGLNRGIIVTPTVANNLSTITGGAISTGTSGGTLSVFQTNPTNSLTIASVIADNGVSSLIKNGAGLLTLSGSNTYAGGTVIHGGVVNITGGAVAFDQANSRALGTGNVTVNSGSTLRNSTDRGVSGGQLTTRTVTLNAATLNLVNQDYLYQNTLTGSTISGGGLYRVGNLVDSGLITTLASATTSTISAPVDMTFRNLSLAVADGAASSDLTISSVISQNTGAGSGAKSISKSGAGTLTLSGLANTFTGGITVTGGELRSEMGTSATGTYTPFGNGGAVTVNSGATLRLRAGSTTNTFTFANAINLNAANVIYEDGNHILSGNIALTGSNSFSGVWSGKTLRLNGIVSGTGSITHSGASTLTLAGVNTYEGGTTLNGGTLAVANSSGLGAGAVTVTGNSTLTVSVALAKDISVNSGVTLSMNGGFINHTGIISGEGNVTATGNIHLRGENTYTGKTTASGGFLCIDRDRNLGAVPASFVADSLTLTGGGNISNYIATAPVVLHANRGITLASGNTGLFDVVGQTMTVNGVISGAGNLLKQNNGNLLLTAQNTYTGRTQIYGGTVSFSTIKNVGDVTGSSLGNVANATDGTISIGFGTNVGTLTYTGTGSTSDRVINLAGTTGGANLNQSGTGLLKFTSAFTATGAGSKTLTLSGSTAGIGEIAGAIVNNSVTNTTTVTKTGTGTWLLTGSNTYTGTTTVNGGTLGGSGCASSALSVNATATLAPGASVGTFLASSAIFTNATFAVEIDRASTTADKLVVPGSVDLLNTSLVISEIGTGTVPLGTKFTIVDYTGGSLIGEFNGLIDGATINAGSTVYTINYADASKITLTASAVIAGYDSWKTQITNGETLRTEDADDDGFTNLQEFLFGTDPMAGNGTLSTTEKSGNTLIIRWKQRTSGATYLLKESATLTNPWANSSAAVSNDGAASGDYQPRKAEVTIGTGSLFFRVEGTEN